MSIAALIAFLEASKYWLIFAGSYIEGSVVMIATGTLLRAGTVDLLPAFMALLLGDILADVMWYYIGYFGARRIALRWGSVLHATPEVLDKVEERFHRHYTWILLVSKVTSGLGFAYATLMTAGILRVPIGRFIAINLIGALVWVSSMMFIGYHFGNLVEQLPPEARWVAVIAGFGVAILGLRGMSRYLSRVEW